MRQAGYEVAPQKHNIRMLWKRVRILTDHGEYDLACMYGLPLEALAFNMADRGDVSPCARSATADAAFQSQRCADGEERNQLIYRSMATDRDRFTHLGRWLKYAIAKYPGREVVYCDSTDADLFAPLNALRFQITDLYAELVDQNKTPTNFEPFRHLLPELYAHLAKKAGIQAALVNV